MKKDIYYTPCSDTSTSCNPAFKSYFRLYDNSGEYPVLIDQGLAEEKLDDWKKNYNAYMSIDNPYPELD